MGAGVEYVSGRLRAKGEMNGKSANLNNCLTQIYPEGVIVPHNELVISLSFCHWLPINFYVVSLWLESSACFQLFSYSSNDVARRIRIIISYMITKTVFCPQSCIRLQAILLLISKSIQQQNKSIQVLSEASINSHCWGLLQVCIFDSDQLANSDFYNKTVPLFDLGDDVGMVLSPQAFHNLNVHADIFNHSNIHFWEYSQPGYDALGFISCTGLSLSGCI